MTPDECRPSRRLRLDVIVILHGPVGPSQADEVMQLATSYLVTGGARLSCEISGRVDLSVVDALCRLQLVTKRQGGCLRVRHNACSAELAALLSYLGLESVAALLEPGGQAEAGE